MIRTALIEHDTHSVQRLKQELKPFSAIQIIGEAVDSEAAIRLIDSLKPDLVMLNIQLPGFSGFDVLNETAYLPMAVFITEYEPYTMRALEKYHLPHVLKPYTNESLAKALQQVAGARQRVDLNMLSQVRLEMEKRIYTHRFIVKSGSETLVIPAESIHYFEAWGSNAVLHTFDSKHTYSASIDELEHSLDPEIFYRIDKDHIISVLKLKRMTRRMSGKYTLRIGDLKKTKLKAIKPYIARLRARYRKMWE